MTLGEGEWRFGDVRVPCDRERRFDRLAMAVPFSPVLWKDDQPQASGCLWAGVKGSKGLDLLRRFPAAPSIIVKKGSNATAVWSVWPEVKVPFLVDYNERLARFFGGRVRDASPLSFTLDLTRGEVFFLNNLHDASHVAGRL